MSKNTGNEYSGSYGGRSAASSRASDMPWAAPSSDEVIPF